MQNHAIALDDDDGFIEVQFMRDGVRQTVAVDLYAFTIALEDAVRAAADAGGHVAETQLAAMRSVLRDFGIDADSYSNRAISKVCERAMARLDELKKKDDAARTTLPSAD